LVEQRIRNAKVASSIPASGTKLCLRNLQGLFSCRFLLFKNALSMRVLKHFWLKIRMDSAWPLMKIPAFIAELRKPPQHWREISQTPSYQVAHLPAAVFIALPDAVHG
jgi:hypothetical protein